MTVHFLRRPSLECQLNFPVSILLLSYNRTCRVLKEALAKRELTRGQGDAAPDNKDRQRSSVCL